MALVGGAALSLPPTTPDSISLHLTSIRPLRSLRCRSPPRLYLIHRTNSQLSRLSAVNGSNQDPPQDDTLRDENVVSDPGVTAALALIRFYKREISPLLLPSCRYVPSCSSYAMEAYKRYGFGKGTVLTAWRICRCNPLGPGYGYSACSGSHRTEDIVLHRMTLSVTTLIQSDFPHLQPDPVGRGNTTGSGIMCRKLRHPFSRCQVLGVPKRPQTRTCSFM